LKTKGCLNAENIPLEPDAGNADAGIVDNINIARIDNSLRHGIIRGALFFRK